jgi:hypothetical protein
MWLGNMQWVPVHPGPVPLSLCGAAIKKGRHSRETPPFVFKRVGFLAGAPAGGTASATASTSAAAPNGVIRFDSKSIRGHVDSNGAGLFSQGFFQKEGVAHHVKGLVVVTRLIQSQRKLGACSAPGS